MGALDLAATAAYVRVPLLETIAIACGALPLSLAFGAPAALAIARGGVVGRLVRGAAALVRAIPELVLAIVFVVALGFGAVPGTLALGLSGAATVARLYAELLESVRRDPEEALRATGATRATSFLVGLVPAAWPGLVGFAAYAFESTVRASVVVGVVGAGGIGSALMSTLNVADYPSFYLYVVVLVALVLAVDRASEVLRLRAPVWLAFALLGLVTLVGIAAFAATDTPWSAFRTAPEHLGHYLARAFPPAFTPVVRATALRGVVETLFVAFAGTIVGAIAAIPLGFSLSRLVASGWMRGTGYRPWSLPLEALATIVSAIARATPPVALALLALAWVGLGPKAGAVALAIHTAGVLAKLFAESLELAETAAAEALVASGSTASATVLTAIVPPAASALIAHLLYRVEWNVRASTTLGIVGAGGLGQAIFNAQQLFHDRELAAYVLVAIALVLVADTLTVALRRGITAATMVR